MPTVWTRSPGDAWRHDLPLVATILLIGLMLGGCRATAVPVERDGERYGVTNGPFYGRWWHYLERGISYARGGFYQRAESDLRACLRMRAEDSRRARTYGMRFVHCFPNRELGAVLVAQERFDEARRYLQRSLASEPTAKAAALLRAVDRAEAKRSGYIEPPVPVEVGALVIDRMTEVDGIPAIAGQVAIDAADATVLAVDDVGQVRPVAVDDAGAFRATGTIRSLMLADPEDGRIAVELPVADGERPVLRLDGPADGQVVAAQRVWYRYHAAHPAGIEAVLVRVGDDERTVAAGGPWPQLAGTVACDLPAAGARIQVIARCVDGHELVRDRVVRVRTPVVTASRLRAAALFLPLLAPFADDWRDHPDDAGLLAALVGDGRFRYRDRRFDALLARELALVDAGLVGPQSAARSGRRLAARYVVAGTMDIAPDEAECYLRLIHAESGRVVVEADAYARLDAGTGRREFHRAVAGRLRQAFPVLSGVVAIESGQVVDLSVDQGVDPCPGLHFHLISPTGVDRRELGLIEYEDDTHQRLLRGSDDTWRGPVVSE